MFELFFFLRNSRRELDIQTARRFQVAHRNCMYHFKCLIDLLVHSKIHVFKKMWTRIKKKYVNKWKLQQCASWGVSAYGAHKIVQRRNKRDWQHRLSTNNNNKKWRTVFGSMITMFIVNCTHSDSYAKIKFSDELSAQKHKSNFRQTNRFSVRTAIKRIVVFILHSLIQKRMGANSTWKIQLHWNRIESNLIFSSFLMHNFKFTRQKAIHWNGNEAKTQAHEKQNRKQNKRCQDVTPLYNLDSISANQ